MGTSHPKLWRGRSLSSLRAPSSSISPQKRAKRARGSMRTSSKRGATARTTSRSSSGRATRRAYDTTCLTQASSSRPSSTAFLTGARLFSACGPVKGKRPKASARSSTTRGTFSPEFCTTMSGRPRITTARFKSAMRRTATQTLSSSTTSRSSAGGLGPTAGLKRLTRFRDLTNRQRIPMESESEFLKIIQKSKTKMVRAQFLQFR
mmetsp:Transcript_31896/g.36423  ORF Transcript_31896/g.36423 Transcript_31896/m.36423 type:complete len:206 (+) Transcript_31896:78-695(+)